MKVINYRLGLEQRLFPEYRKPLFELLASQCKHGFCLFAGKAQPVECILEGSALQNGELVRGNNRYVIHGKRYFFRQENFLTWLESWKPQVLIVEANPRYLGLKQGIDWMHQHGGKVIGWGLGTGDSDGILARFRKGFRKKFVQNFDVLISYSQKGKVEYLDAGIPPQRIFVASNAVSQRPSWSLPSRAGDFSQHKPGVLFVGRLLERKSVDHLIKACSKIPLKDQPELVIVGEGSARSDLEALAAQVYPTTRFTGDLREEELANAYRIADLFVLPGTGGLAIQQAMSYGLPIIAGIGDGTQSDLVRVENGWQLHTDTVDELTKVLAAALKDQKKLRRMGEASFEIVKNEVNLEAMVDTFANAVEFAMKMDKQK
jgi:glycosyltransferase involved in cell wall biosynthesis